MKHKGKAFAIYATPRRAYLIAPGEQIPRNARFVTSHADGGVLAWALDKSTDGLRNGARVPCNGEFHSFSYNVEAVLQRVVNRMIEPISLQEFQTLRHTLGHSHLSKTNPDLGWRNYINIPSTATEDYAVVKTLEERGLIVEFREDFYRATRRGMILAGVPSIEEVIEE